MSSKKNLSPIGDTVTNGLVGAERCLEILFPDRSSRLSLRFFRTLQLNGTIPHFKISRRVLFDPPAVRAALEHQFARKAVAA
jgi:hypothetical protein